MVHLQWSRDKNFTLSEWRLIVNTQQCISTTAREAMQKGYQVILVEDAIGDRDIPGVKGEELTRVALAELADVFGTVVNSADIA